MRVAVYGGSFNPPHLGHIEAAGTVARELRPDRFLIIPAGIPPHKALAEGSPTPEERMELCRLAFAEIPGGTGPYKAGDRVKVHYFGSER